MLVHNPWVRVEDSRLNKVQTVKQIQHRKLAKVEFRIKATCPHTKHTSKRLGEMTTI